MLRRGWPAAGLIAMLLAGVATAQTVEERPPPVDEPLLMPENPITPKGGVPVLTLAEKEELRKFCAQAANKRAAECAGFAPRATPLPATQ